MSDDVYSRVRKGGLKLKGSARARKQARDQEKPVEATADERDNLLEETVDDKEANKDQGGDINSEAHNIDMDVVEADIKKLASMEDLTPAERAHRLHQLHRRRDKLALKLKQTHREKMEEFNKKLNSLSEHFDVPKVGPG